jgi:uncharacterized protein with von Willebrand factor type A (vWA) domain
MMDLDALPAALQQPVTVRALEELKMLTQTDLERERYEARRKAQLDENTLVGFAHREGLEKGEKIGIVWAIHRCERSLKRPETPMEELTALSLEDLTRLAEELHAQALGKS